MFKYTKIALVGLWRSSLGSHIDIEASRFIFSLSFLENGDGFLAWDPSLPSRWQCCTTFSSSMKSADSCLQIQGNVRMQHHQCTTFEEEEAKIPVLLHNVCDNGKLSMLLLLRHHILLSTAMNSHEMWENGPSKIAASYLTQAERGENSLFWAASQLCRKLLQWKLLLYLLLPNLLC